MEEWRSEQEQSEDEDGALGNNLVENELREETGNNECDVTNHVKYRSKSAPSNIRVKRTLEKVKLPYRCTGFYKEGHGQPLYGVSVNPHVMKGKCVMFATVGFNRVTVYQTEETGDKIKMLQCYADPDTKENFYSCAWSYDTDTGNPILAAGGVRGIVRVLSPASMTCVRNLVGHTNSINEVMFHPMNPDLLVSASEDHALRLWNVKTGHNIAKFGGVEGHRDQVLSVHFNMNGTKIVSSGMDNSLKIWHLDTKEIQATIELSNTFDINKTKRGFPTQWCHFPDFTTRDIHYNYVDCCRWFGDFILSKSVDNNIVCWKPGGLGNEKSNDDKKTTVIQTLEVEHCEIWFIRFSMDSGNKVLALGNTKGNIYIWDLMVSYTPSLLQPTILSHPKCTNPVRQISLSKDGAILIAVCNTATIWRWDRKDSRK